MQGRYSTNNFILFCFPQEQSLDFDSFLESVLLELRISIAAKRLNSECAGKSLVSLRSLLHVTTWNNNSF